MNGETVRLTTAQAIVRYLQAQWSERDGDRRRLIPDMWGIFGHGNVTCLGDALEAAGIPSALLKGPALARTVYPDPALRQSVDIDLLVRPGDVLPVQLHPVLGIAVSASHRCCKRPAGGRRLVGDEQPAREPPLPALVPRRRRRRRP